MNILDLSKELNVDVIDFVSEYSNQFPNIEKDDLNNIRSVLEYNCFEEHINEYADRLVPVYTAYIDREYERVDVAIDDLFEDCLIISIKSEADITHAKSTAILLHYQRTITEEFNNFVDDIQDAIDRRGE